MKILVYQDDGITPAGFITNIVLGGDLTLREIDGVATNPEAANVPEIPQTPTAQDVTDALLALGLVSQASV